MNWLPPVPRFLTLTLAFLTLPPAYSAVHRVDLDAPGPNHDGATWATAFPTVAQGLSAAKDGDEVWVAAGTYTENITLTPGAALYGGFAGTETERAQRDPGAHQTIVDGNKAGTVVTVSAAAPATTILDGFTIHKGNPFGVHCLAGSTPIIRNNTVTGSRSTGIVCVTGEALVVNNMILHNAGGISVSGNTIVRNNVIRWNRYGGVRIYGIDPVEKCVVSGNLIADAPDGEGVYVQMASASVTGNRIERNKEGVRLGMNIWSNPRFAAQVLGNSIRGNRETSISIWYTADATIIGNAIAGSGIGISAAPGGTHLIANNTISGHAKDAVNIVAYPDEPITVQMVNNIIAYNGGAVYAMYANDGVQYDLRRNCYWANGNPDPTDKWYLKPTAGEIVADPLLADPSRGDLHIAPNSPCRDAGEGLPVLADLQDIDGQPRVQGASVDIGADESDGTVPDFVVPVVYVRPDGDDANDGTTWASAKQTVQAGIDASGCGEVWIAGGVYRERVTLPPLVHLYGGFTGNETGRDGVRSNETVLDGMKGGSVLTVLTGNLVNVVDGLTITNGTAQFGGGVLANGGVILENCVVTGNTAEEGGGVYARAGTPILRGCRIEMNSASRGSSGVHQAWDASNTTLERNVIRWNTSATPYGTIDSDRAALILRGNILVGNEGGCVRAWGPLEMINNTVVGNTGFNSGVDAAWGPAVFVNNIVAFNTGGVAYSLAHTGLVFRNNCVFGNTGSQYPAPDSGTGNIVADPLFVNRFGDQHLRAGSPCIDAGDNAYRREGDLDIDGQPRRIGPRVDIGADENTYDAVLLSEVGSALRVVGGMEAVAPETLARWNVNVTGSPDSLTLEDVLQLTRKALGLE